MSGNVQIPITWKYYVESHIVPRLWGFENIWDFFPISWKIDRNTHIFPAREFEELAPANLYNSQNMEKVNSQSKKKILEEINIRKLRVS